MYRCLLKRYISSEKYQKIIHKIKNIQKIFQHKKTNLTKASPGGWVPAMIFYHFETPRGPDEGGGPGEIAAERPTAPLLAPFAAAEGGKF